MLVRTPLLRPALYLIAAIGSMASPAIRAEPEKAVAGAKAPTPSLRNSMRELPVLDGRQERTRLSSTGRVANAIRPLDLSKLSMSDFGDVAPDY